MVRSMEENLHSLLCVCLRTHSYDRLMGEKIG